MRQLPIRVRLTLWYVGLLAIILAAFGIGVYLMMRQSLYHNLDQSIEIQAGALMSTVQVNEGKPTLQSSFPPPRDHDDNFVQVVEAPSPSDFFDDELRVRSFPITQDGLTLGWLEIGQSREDVDETLGTLLIILGLSYPITLAVAVLGGIFLARRALSPVDAITGLARRISAEDLGRRLNLQLPDDEVGRLAQTFDDMIQRLDEAFRRQRQFTADASHELRTPLTVMKGQVEVALQRDRAPDDYRDVLAAVNSEVDRLIELAGNLLTLARADSGEFTLQVESVALSDLVSGTVDHMRSGAEEKGVTIEFDASDDTSVEVDEGLIIQLLINLLDNAIKYTPEGGTVTVGWETIGERAELWVRDAGIGIPEDHLPHLTNRFYRVDDSRTSSVGGTGLGLSICLWIALSHGGDLRVESVVDQGSTFTVDLPVAA